MKKYFQNIPITCWEHKGRRLGFRPSSICLFSKHEGVDILLRAIDEVTIELPPSKRTLTLKPSQEPGALKSIKLSYSPISEKLRFMSFFADENSAYLNFTEYGVIEIVSALKDWRDGAEDFCLYPREKKAQLGEEDIQSWEIWFWVTMVP